MMFDVGVRENKQKAMYVRVHNSVLSRFVYEEQRKGFVVFSVIPLFRNTRITPEVKEVIKEFKIDRLDKACIDSHGF